MSGRIDKHKGDFNHGDIINNKYLLFYKIGYGTFSTVWLAYLLDTEIQEQDKKFYAIKVYHQDEIDCAKDEIDFYVNVKKTDLKTVYLHEIIHFKPLNSKDDRPSVCFVMDYMTCSVSKLLDLTRFENGFSEELTLKIIKEISYTLDKLLDMGYIYGDIRSENILIKSNNDLFDTFLKMFYDLHYDIQWKEYCNNLLKENDYNLENKRHKEKFNIKKRKYSMEHVPELAKRLYKECEHISRNIQFNIDTPIFLADFGGIVKNEERNDEFHIHCRPYKAPEVILRIPYDEKVDIWSLGCLMYELLTNEYLFDPKEYSDYSEDFNHIYWFVELLGQFPLSMVRKAKTKEKFFYKNGNFRIDMDVDDWSIEKSLNRDCLNMPSQKTINLLKRMLQYESHLRPNYKEIISEIDNIINEKML